MITITPPLPISCKTASGNLRSGILISLSAEQARVDWTKHPQNQDGEPITALTVETSEFRGKTLSVSSSEQGIIKFSQDSLPVLQDLLHVIRKGQHLDLCANRDVEHSERNNGFSEVKLPVVALPERSWSEISTETAFLGRNFSAPILITGMTGGVAQATVINERLASAAAQHNIPMGVGSQRLALENPVHAEIFKLKKKFPKLFLVGNVGIGQLMGKDFLELCQRATDMISADALAIHVNVLQELIQVEGDRDFRGIIEKIGVINSKLGRPIVVKEVGAGLDLTTAKKLHEVGVRCFDVGGSGGTSWALIEGLRADDPLIRRRGEVFRDWGIPTAKALASLAKELPESSLIATGGIRDGLTVLKAKYLGATMVGIGLPLMRAAPEGPEMPTKLLGSIIHELKIAKICSGL